MRIRGFSVAVLFLASFMPGCKNKDATPAGIVLLEWEPSKSTRPTFAKATIGARTRTDMRMTLEPPAKGGPVQFLLAIDYAPVDFDEDGKSVHHTSVVALRITVERNEDWTTTAKCSGPDYQMGPIGPDKTMITPEAMVLQCSFILKYGPDFTYSRSLWMQGDGVLKPEGTPDVKVTLEAVKP